MSCIAEQRQDLLAHRELVTAALDARILRARRHALPRRGKGSAILYCSERSRWSVEISQQAWFPSAAGRRSL
jgi:hypothetical protein